MNSPEIKASVSDSPIVMPSASLSNGPDEIPFEIPLWQQHEVRKRLRAFEKDQSAVIS
jgi:hypothetical protein